MQNRDITFALVLVASLLFCIVILYSGTRRQRIWNPVGWMDIDKRKSPWNYRVAVFIWAFAAVFALIGLFVETWKLLR